MNKKLLWCIPCTHEAAALTASILIIVIVAFIMLRAFNIDPVGAALTGAKSLFKK